MKLSAAAELDSNPNPVFIIFFLLRVKEQYYRPTAWHIAINHGEINFQNSPHKAVASSHHESDPCSNPYLAMMLPPAKLSLPKLSQNYCKNRAEWLHMQLLKDCQYTNLNNQEMVMIKCVHFNDVII